MESNTTPSARCQLCASTYACLGTIARTACLSGLSLSSLLPVCRCRGCYVPPPLLPLPDLSLHPSGSSATSRGLSASCLPWGQYGDLLGPVLRPLGLLPALGTV